MCSYGTHSGQRAEQCDLQVVSVYVRGIFPANYSGGIASVFVVSIGGYSIDTSGFSTADGAHALDGAVLEDGQVCAAFADHRVLGGGLRGRRDGSRHRNGDELLAERKATQHRSRKCLHHRQE